MLFLLCATAAAPASLTGFFDNGCPKDTRIEKFLPHKNCGRYYQCFHGALVSRNCPSGENFNADLEICDSTPCFSTTSEINYTTTEELDSNNPSDANQICLTSDLNDVLVAHENCNEFYKCSHGIAVALKCARGLLFNTLTDKCDWPQNVDCGDRLTVGEMQILTNKDNIRITSPNLNEKIEIDNTYSSQATILCSSKHTDGVLVPHEYCNSFYKCSKGEPVTVKCASNLLYDTVKKHCDRPEDVQCDGRIITEEGGSSKNTGDKNNKSEENESSREDHSPAIICDKKSEKDVAAHEKCNHFYKCLGKEAVAFKCPGNLLFNSKKNICDWPNNVDCGDKIKSDDTDIEIEKKTDNNQAEKLKSADAYCSTDGSNGVLFIHESCNKFYKCIDGNPVENKCPGMLLFNPKTENCDWPTHVSCEDRTMPENGLSLKESDQNNVDIENENGNITSSYFLKRDVDRDNENDDENNVNSRNGDSNDIENKSEFSESNDYLTDATKICDAENSDGILLPHENCNQYYKCFERGAMAQFCQLNHFYNPKKAQCDWIRNVNCDNREIPKNGIYDDEEETKNDDECDGNEDGVILPHENCSQFYKCVQGQKYAMECLPGLYYDTSLKVCDWPMKVDCGDRLTEAQVRDQNQIL